jgi:predicted dehydrogenase
MTLNILQVGLGYWGPILLRNINAQEDVCITAFDENPDAVAKLKGQYTNINFVVGTPSSEDFEAADAAIIVTPPHTHSDLAALALDSECHVFVEKPLTLDSESALQLVDKAVLLDKILMVGHTFLFVPEVREIKRLLDEGIIGTLLHIESNRKNLGKYQECGVIWDLAPHDIALLYYFTGLSPEDLDWSVNSRPSTPLDIATIFGKTRITPFSYQLNLSWLHPIKERTTYFVGDKGMLVYDMMAKDKVLLVERHVQANRDGYKHVDGAVSTVPVLDTEEPLFKEIKEFLEAIGTGELLISDGIMGHSVVKTVEKLGE